jgi:hypothetical protein
VVVTLILDALDPEGSRRPPMAMKDYSDEFEADAVALYGATARGDVQDPDKRIRPLEVRVAELEASGRKLATERNILREAARYFAGETNW